MFLNFPNFCLRDTIPANVCSGVIVRCLIVSSVCFGKGAFAVAKAFLLMLIIKSFMRPQNHNNNYKYWNS